jgi:thymidylate synthase
MKSNYTCRAIHAQTIGEGWIKSIKEVMDFGSLHYDEDIIIKEILGLNIEILNPKPEDHIIKKHGDSAIVKRTLAKFRKGVVMLDRPFTYGACIYDHSGVDQFEWMIERLLTKNETKSATICLLTPGNQSANLPCLTTIDAKIRNEKLVLQFFFRSQNIFGRQYANLLALARLQNDLSDRCSVGIGSLKGYIASAHMYEYDFSDAQLLISSKKVHIQDKYYTNGPKSIRIE